MTKTMRSTRCGRSRRYPFTRMTAATRAMAGVGQHILVQTVLANGALQVESWKQTIWYPLSLECRPFFCFLFLIHQFLRFVSFFFVPPYYTQLRSRVTEQALLPSPHPTRHGGGTTSFVPSIIPREYFSPFLFLPSSTRMRCTTAVRCTYIHLGYRIIHWITWYIFCRV